MTHNPLWTAVAVFLLAHFAAQPAVGLLLSTSRCACPEGFAAECGGAEDVTLARSWSECQCVRASGGEQTSVPCLGGNENGSVIPEINGGNGAEDDSCDCTREFIPQCDEFGEEVASNECIRNCMGYTRQEVNFLNCGLVSSEEYFAEFAEPETEDEEGTQPVVDTPQVSGNDTRGSDKGGEETGCNEACEAGTEWVCDQRGSRLAVNSCAAECKGYTPDAFSSEYCSAAYRDSVMCGCNLQTDDLPICNSMAQEMAPNSCVAQCLGYTQPDFNAANCNATVPLSICGFIYSPLCDDKGSIWADNLCVANTLYSQEVVGELEESFCAPGVRENAACDCANESQPVCDSLWTEIASSPCVAECLGYSEWQPCVNQFQPLISPPDNDAMVEPPPDNGNSTASDRISTPDAQPPPDTEDSAASTTKWVLAQAALSAMCICLLLA